MEDLQPTEAPANGAPPPEPLASAPAEPVGKRQRRPSVRLGDIGEQSAAIPHEPLPRRSKQWRNPQLFPPNLAAGKAPSRTRPLTNLGSDEGPPYDPALQIPAVARLRGFCTDHENMEILMGIRKGKPRRIGEVSSRRVRTNWVSKVEEGEGVDAADTKSSGDDAGDEGYREYDDLRVEDLESPRAVRGRLTEAREGCLPNSAEAAEVDMPVREDREWSKGQCHLADGGVVAWLNGLGLGRYAPVFQIHEVDDEVLPHLTLEDLKDMGINAVGSRRKMYCAIQKLRKSSS